MLFHCNSGCTSMLRYTQTSCLLRVYVNPIGQKEWNWESFYPSTYVSPVSIILPMLLTLLHLNSLLIKRTSGRANFLKHLNRKVFLLCLQDLSCCSPVSYLTSLGHTTYCNKCSQTMGKIGANYRLLIINGHGSYCNKPFNTRDCNNVFLNK
jgi:hypothetical protein